jgi:hypothetical protein
MIYIEFCSRKPDASLEAFHEAWHNGQEGWGGSFDDLLAWSGARTWRLGPEPEYLAVWDVRDAGLSRLDDWDRIFKGGEADSFEDPFAAVARIDFGGWYEGLIESTRVRGKRYYAEYFRPTGPDDEIRSLYRDRDAKHDDLDLIVLVRRVGKLAPDPGGLAVWSAETFAEMQHIVTDLDGVDHPVELVMAGVYADVGEEEL